MTSSPMLLVSAAALTACATFDPPATARRDSAVAVSDVTSGDVADDATALNGCADAMFVDRTADDASRSVSFGAALGAAYGPRCITISAGQSVTFTGAFAGHPLHRGSGPTQLDTGSAGNPIPDVSTGAEAVVTFPRAGTFPFHCGIHFGGGMSGAVRVR